MTRIALTQTFFLLFFLNFSSLSQTTSDSPEMASKEIFYKPKTQNFNPELIEICDNNIDDDGDGLTDCDDPDCYFSDPICECHETDIIWTVDFDELRWHNVNTGIGQSVGNTVAFALGDIAWSPTGELYGCDLGGTLYKINHNTGLATQMGNPGWEQPNSMVCDADGNIIIAENDPPFRVLSYNPTTLANTTIVSSTQPYFSSGDLAFVNETLYLLVQGPALLKINVSTGNYTHIPISGFSGSPWGIANNAQGQLFLSLQDDFYELDPMTGNATYLSTANDSDPMRGLSMLGDFCESQIDSLDITIEANDVFCEGDLGELVLTIHTNLPHLEYYWEAVPSSSPNGVGDFPITSNPQTFTIEDLPTGDYAITLTDGIDNDNTIILNASINFTIPTDVENIFETTCSLNEAGIFEEVYQNQFGCDSLVITEITYIPPDNHFINLTSCNPLDTGTTIISFQNQFGCDSIEIITVEYAIADSTFFNEVSCFASDTGLIIQNLTNQFGCDSLVFSQTDLVILDAELINNPISCFGYEDGIIEITNPKGGHSPYLYSLNGMNFQDNPVYQNLPEGAYEITVQDANGCEESFLTQISAPSELILELGEDIEIQLGDSIQLVPKMNHPNVQSFVWTPELFLSNPNELRPFAKPIETTTFELTVFLEDDCFATDFITVIVDKNRGVYIPNAFSPNGDGINDVMMIFANPGIELVEEFLIFDRWGALVFENSNFLPNDSGQGWDGKLDDQKMSPAVFTYLAKVKYLDGENQMFKGDVVLVR